MKRKATSKLPATPPPASPSNPARVSFAVSGPVFGWLVKIRSAWQHDAGLRGMAMRAILGAVLFAFGVMRLTAASAQEPVLSDNASSIAVVVGNRDYKQTSAVDFAHNDADAIKAWLIGTLGFREQNVFLLKDATLGELNQAFGSEANPQGGRLWRSVSEGRSNVFIYYSGHGVPDLATRQPFLLPQDGSPGSAETGYALQTLYRNLELVRQKIGPQRQVIVMIDACFTGETGRKGESLLAVSAPGFTPAKPRSGNGIVKLVATSGATPANWDQETKLGLFTSRFLMGVAGLAGGSQGKAVALPDLKRYVIDSVTEAAQRENRREQIPEIDEASLSLPVGRPVPAVADVFAAVQDENEWQRARASGERLAFEDYIAACGATCRFREEALQHLQGIKRAGQAASDRENWVRLSATGSYADYLKGCGTVCAYKSLAEGYLGQPLPRDDENVRKCDELAGMPEDKDRNPAIPGVHYIAEPADQAITACRSAVKAHPELRRLSFQLGRAYEKAKSYEEAVAALKSASNAGSAASAHALGGLVANASGVPQNQAEMHYLYEVAAQENYVPALVDLGRLYLEGRAVPEKDWFEARRLFVKAAEAGNTDAMGLLAQMHMWGNKDFPQSLGEVRRWNEMAARAGVASAMVSVAQNYEAEGILAPSDLPRALEWYEKALKAGEAVEKDVDRLRKDVEAQKRRPK